MAALAILATGCSTDQIVSPVLEEGAALAAGSTLAAFPQVSAGEVHSCVLAGDGSLACWGSNASGRATPPAGQFTQLSAGRAHSCAVRTNGLVACWGSNLLGEATSPIGSFTQVSAGSLHSCGVRTDGAIQCWGFNGNRQATAPAGTFTQVAAGGSHSCARRSDGTIACWGSDANRQATPPAGAFLQVGAGMFHSCGVKADRSIACWGSNAGGQATPPAGSYSQVSDGMYFSCAVRSDATIACWGDNSSGQSRPPAGSFVQVSAGATHACAVTVAGTLKCWGQNTSGQATPPVLTPADGTAPVITPLVTGTAGANGWYTGDVIVSWTVTDPESAVTSSTGCAPSTIVTDTDAATFTCSATNAAGLTSSVSRAVKRDATLPTVTWSGNASSYQVDAIISIGCTAADATNPGSGLAAHGCQAVEGSAYLFAAGPNTFSATATDHAGNTASAAVTFTVQVTYDGVCTLAGRMVAKAGVADAMCHQLRAAQAAASRNDEPQRLGAMRAFGNLVRAQTGKSVSSADAAVLLRLGGLL